MRDEFIQKLLSQSNKFSLEERSSLIELYYSDKKTVENYADFHEYMRPKIIECLNDDAFLFHQLEKIQDAFTRVDFFKVDINPSFAFMSALNINIKAVQVQQLLGFLFDFEDFFKEMPTFKSKIVRTYVESFAATLEERYGSELFTRPYFSSLSDIHKKLTITKSLLPAETQINIKNKK